MRLKRGLRLLRASMFPWLRLGKVLVTAPARNRLGPLDASVVRFRVWPSDLDNNLHLNNARYLAMMDLGRWDLMLRTGLLKELVLHRWNPIVASATIRYRRSLDPFQEYDLCTRILGWDERGFYIEQRFERNGTTHAIGVIYGMFVGPQGRVPPQGVVERRAPGAASPKLPEWVETWRKSQEALSTQLSSDR